MPHKTEPLEHLFRTEFSKMVSVLSYRFTLAHIQTAEDIVSDTFLLASENWASKGVPKNPKAWLYTVAINRTKDYLKRKNIFEHKIKKRLLQEVEENLLTSDFNDRHIEDSQLRMLCVISSSLLPELSKVTLALRVLCGLGIDEIASALFCTKDLINKRLYRAKKLLKKEKLTLDIDIQQCTATTLDTLLTILYLLFNAGYFNTYKNEYIQEVLCFDALSLTHILVKQPHFATPKVYAFLALMCFHLSRFDARRNSNNLPIPYHDQDEERWDFDLIEKGKYYLNLSIDNKRPSRYHLEAGIAFWHTQKNDTSEKWEQILHLYDQLLHYSPSTALNRSYAFFKVHGRKLALTEIKKLSLEKLSSYHLLLAEVYGTKQNEKRIYHLNRAKALSKSTQERYIIDTKLKQS